MAKKDKKGNKPFTKDENASSKPAESKTDAKKSSNKPLLGVLVLIGLITLSAVGVGAYYAYDSLTSDDDDTEESSTNDSESDEDNGSENSNDDNNSNDSSDNSDDNDSEENVSNNDSDNTDDRDNSEDSDNNGNETEGNESEDGSISESSAKTSLENNPGYKKSLANQLVIAQSGVWEATDYVPGDITQSEYEVQLGDTLWEIAEGYYGSGFEWGKILNNNESKIGHLPNGEQALITPGTVLVLPQ